MNLYSEFLKLWNKKRKRVEVWTSDICEFFINPNPLVFLPGKRVRKHGGSSEIWTADLLHTNPMTRYDKPACVDALGQQFYAHLDVRLIMS